MKILLRLVSLLFLAGACASRGFAAADGEITEQEIKLGYRRHTLLAKPRATLAEIERAEAGAGLRLVRAHPRFGGWRTLEFDGNDDVKDVAARLQQTGLYETVELDLLHRLHAVPNDLRYARDQWSLNNTGQEGGTRGADIKAEAGWDIQREAPDVVVAVIDTGVRLVHRDISANLWKNPGEFGAQPSIDNDGNGYIDDVNGINATVSRTSALAGNPDDDEGHGSHVAGIIGAVGNNEEGITGVAWRVQIMPLKFLTSRGTGSTSALVACLDYAIAKGAKIINASYGSVGFSQAEFDAMKRVREAGIIFVASAGNDSQEISELPEYPAAYLLDNIVAVASTTRQDKLASYSTFGSGLVDLAAPGSSILSLGIGADVTFVTKSGTSMAAPHVTGALALLKQRFPNDSYRGLINRLLSGVDVLPDLENRVLTNGRLNLFRALSTTDARPFNDDFARRAIITGSFNTIRGANQLATTEAGEPSHGVAGVTGTLWWQWTAPAAGKVTLNTAGSAIDTVLAVYLAPGTAALGTLQRIAFNDDTSSTVTTSSVTFDATAGTTYAIAIGGKNNAEGLVTFSLLTTPLHDAFAQARALSGPSVVVDDNNSGATAETGEPKVRNSLNNPIGTDKTLWYRWVAPETRPYQISVHGTVTDPVTAIYTGSTLTGLTQVAFDDDSGPGTDSLVRFNAIAGVTYYICVDSFAASGKFTLSIADAAWQYVTDDPLPASPAIGADGSAYLADEFGYVHAITPTGARRWRNTSLTTGVAGYVLGGSTAIAADGTVYIGDSVNYLNALDPATGLRRWRFQTQGVIWSAPAIAADGTIYVHSDDGYLYAINPDASQKWRFLVPGSTYTAPSIAADGTIYIGAGDDSALYALNPDGTQKWRFNLGATVYASPAIGSDGTLYLGNSDGRFFAINPNGTERWRFDTNSPLSSSAVIDARGYVYFGSYDKKLYALDAATGVKKWDYATGNIIRSTAPIIADDGTIYVGSDDGLIYGLNQNGTLRRTYATGGPILGAPVIAGGRLYVGSDDAKLYAFDIGANLERSPWPMHRQNLRRTGRAMTIAGIPVFTTQPAAPTGVVAGAAISLTAAATVDSGPIAYQWYLNDIAVAGATSATYAIPSAQGSHAGTYRVIATGTGGATTSAATTLSVSSGTSQNARLINLSILTNIPSAGASFTLGYVVGGNGTSGAKPLVIRAAGPSLGALGVPGTIDDPKMELFAGSTKTGENDNWGGSADLTAALASVGAFAYTGPTSRDAAALASITTRDNSVKVSASNGTSTGTVIAEIYDATPSNAFTASTPRLINVSVNKQIPAGTTLTAGFVISGGGNDRKQVMIRAVGPTLGTAFGVPGVLADPRLELFRGDGTSLANNDNWGAATNAAQVAAAAASVGAFALPLESRDAVLLVTLPPGSYTAQVRGVGTAAGTAIVEIYEVP